MVKHKKQSNGLVKYTYHVVANILKNFWEYIFSEEKKIYMF